MGNPKSRNFWREGAYQLGSFQDKESVDWVSAVVWWINQTTQPYWRYLQCFHQILIQTQKQQSNQPQSLHSFQKVTQYQNTFLK